MAQAVGLLLVLISAVSAWLTEESSAATSRRWLWKRELGSDPGGRGRGILQEIGELDGEWEPVLFPVLEEDNAPSPSEPMEEMADAPKGQPVLPKESGLVNATVTETENSSTTEMLTENESIQTEIAPMLSNMDRRRKPIHRNEGLSSVILVVIAIGAAFIGLALGAIWGLCYLKKQS